MSYLDDLFDKRKAAREARAQLTPEQKQALEDSAANEQRQKAIAYKKFFGEDHNRLVMFDLMNKYHVLSDLPRLPDGSVDPVAEGQRQVVLDLLKRANISMEQLDKILKGEFV